MTTDLREELKSSNFSELQENKIINFVDSILEPELKSKTRIQLKKTIEKDYYRKSNSMLRYFITNISQSNSKLTKKQYVNNIDNNNFIFKKNLSYDSDFKLQIKEHVKGEFLSNKEALYAQKIYSKIKYIEYINENRDIKTYFFTFTLPSEYHMYKQKKQKNPNKIKYASSNFIRNKEYRFNHIPFELQIELELKLLNKIHRYFYKTLEKYIINYISKKHSVNRKEIKEDKILSLLATVDKIKMIEPHASLTPHLHSLFFFDKEFEPIINNIYKLTIEKFKLNKKYCPIENIKTAKASSYVAKYIMKNLSNNEKGEINEAEKKIDTVNQYRRYFSSVRFFNTSNFRHTTQTEINISYSYLKKNYPNYLTSLKENGKSLYYELEQLIINKCFIFEYETKKSTVIDFTLLEEDLSTRFKGRIDTFEKELKSINTILKDLNKSPYNFIYLDNKYIPPHLRGDLKYQTHLISSKLELKQLYKENGYEFMFWNKIKFFSNVYINYYIDKSRFINNEIQTIKDRMNKYVKNNLSNYIKKVKSKIFLAANIKVKSIIDLYNLRKDIYIETHESINSTEDLGLYEYKLIKYQGEL